MTKSRLILPAALILLAAAGPVATADAATALRQGVTIEGDDITLGDLFLDAGDAAETVIATAPEPGRNRIFRVRELQGLAKRYGVDWKATSRFDRVTVERPGKIVPQPMIELALHQALQDAGVFEDVEIEIDQRRRHLYVALDEPETVDVAHFSYDRRSHRFTAQLRAPGAPDGDPAAPLTTLTGRVYPMVAVPVLERRITAGSEIRADNIGTMRVRANLVGRGVVLSPEEIVGMSPRHMIAPQALIRSHEVEPFVLVPRDSRVTMTYVTEVMRLTAVGRALDDGAEGDVIQVENLSSRKTVDATVVGTGHVTVTPPSLVAIGDAPAPTTN